jgi:hypothetical protein
MYISTVWLIGGIISKATSSIISPIFAATLRTSEIESFGAHFVFYGHRIR